MPRIQKNINPRTSARWSRVAARGPVLLRTAKMPIKNVRYCRYCDERLSIYNPGVACRKCQRKLQRGATLKPLLK